MLSEYLDGIRAATTAEALEAAIGADFRHRYQGRTWSRICSVRKEAGRRICDAHEHGRFVPAIGPRRCLTVCGETYGVGYGQNSTGERYVWTYAEEWAVKVLMRNSLGRQCSHAVWDWCLSYPHRALQCVVDGLAGRMPDPPLDRMILARRSGQPVKMPAYERDACANRPCRCGGTRWDWGCGHSGGIDYINWRCDGCPRVYIEHLSPGRLYAIRNEKRAEPARGKP